LVPIILENTLTLSDAKFLSDSLIDDKNIGCEIRLSFSCAVVDRPNGPQVATTYLITRLTHVISWRQPNKMVILAVSNKIYFNEYPMYYVEKDRIAVSEG